MINRPDEIWIESRGRYESPGIVLAPLAIRSAITALGRLVGRDIGTGFPAPAYLDTRFEGLRITAVCHPVSIRSDVLSMRKPQAQAPSLESLCAPLDRPPGPWGPAEGGSPRRSGWAGWFQSEVRARRNFLVTGGTSSGKTTFLNGLLTALAPDERVITIEETPELRVPTANWVALEVRDVPGLEARSLVRLALRLRPDRLLIGEVRGAEAFDLLQACNTGHRGTLTSLHANSARDALARLETLVLTAGLDWPHAAIRSQIATAFDYVVHMERFSGMRKPVEIMALRPADAGGYHLEPVRIPGLVPS
jgi:Flp pilus assembly CpaF family ATPase